MTANTTLAAICIESGLYRHMHAGPPTTTSAVAGYAARLDVARRQEQARLAQEGQRPGQFWVNLDEPKVLILFDPFTIPLIPSQVLSDVLEAVLGAAFASGGCVLESVEPLFERVMRPVFDRHIALGTLANHPTKVMCELLESHGCNQFSLEKRAAPSRHETICDGAYWSRLLND
jgi:endoribonuclease Dicer